MSQFNPIFITLSPERARERLTQGAMVVASTWFPTTSELSAWSRSGAVLYVRQRNGHVEIGPRLASIMAASFCPVLKARLLPHEGGSRLEGRIGLQPVTTAMFIAWAVVLLVWLAALSSRISAGLEPAATLMWWSLALAFTLGAGGLGWVVGGRELHKVLDGLPELLGSAPREDDW